MHIFMNTPLCVEEYYAHLRALWWQTLCRRPRVSRCSGATRNCIYSTHKHYIHLYNSVNSGSSWAFSELLCIKICFFKRQLLFSRGYNICFPLLTNLMRGVTLFERACMSSEIFLKSCSSLWAFQCRLLHLSEAL